MIIQPTEGSNLKPGLIWLSRLSTYIRMVIWLTALSGIISSCGPREVFLQQEELRMIDSTFVAQRKIWTEYLADSCEEYRTVHFNDLVDSLIAERLVEVKQLLNEYE